MKIFSPLHKKEIKHLVNQKNYRMEKKIKKNFPWFNLCPYYLPALFLSTDKSLAVPTFLPCSRQVFACFGKIHQTPWVLSFLSWEATVCSASLHMSKALNHLTTLMVPHWSHSNVSVPLDPWESQMMIHLHLLLEPLITALTTFLHNTV